MNQRSIAVVLFSVALCVPGLFALALFAASLDESSTTTYQPITHTTPVALPISVPMRTPAQLFVPVGAPRNAPYLNWHARTLRQFTLLTPWPDNEQTGDAS